ncbi:peptidase [Kitasatospora sp. NBC_01250]|uniref:peptidase n=1 Tax=Kitasatospora sp. NBC_01250 TaxID=2903571 RepID=UPI002E32A7E3|nr:peptidase [Kitasatospora sp. NBC_01250]
MRGTYLTTLSAARVVARGTAVAAVAALALGAPAARAASPSAQPSSSASGAAPVTSSGTSFLTATTLAAGQSAQVTASTGDYLYWAFAASAGQTDTVKVDVTLPPSAQRHGSQTWTVDLFDGLRRRQACTAGPQNGTADQNTGSVSMSCTLRQIRSWAEPWSGDPLPGTYYVRLSVSDVQQPDLGLAAQVNLQVGSEGGADDAQPEGGDLKAPLVPPVNPGATAAPGATSAPSPTPAATAAATPGGALVAAPTAPKSHWYSGLFSGWNTRWFWTLGGAALASLAGVGGYTLTRHPRGRRPWPPRPPHPHGDLS